MEWLSLLPDDNHTQPEKEITRVKITSFRENKIALYVSVIYHYRKQLF